MITYGELLKRLQGFTKQQLDCTVVVLDRAYDEYNDMTTIYFSGSENDIFDEDHPILVI